MEAHDKFCIVSLRTSSNNPSNIQDLSHFAAQFGCCDGSGGVVGDPHIHTLDGDEFDLYDKGTYSAFHYDGSEHGRLHPDPYCGLAAARAPRAAATPQQGSG
ncbi:amt-3 [Symbiodinium necroappetens]|uniref:Amt-3 protein n=1 Tax=Symbiodinium necroappetens TaxID=1628268 RepID=A0A812NP22_9DINO|nr:amt-3 [Symbiodinium necroappetens]